MSPTPRLFLSPPHLFGDEKKLVAEAIESNWIAPLGPHVDRFEAEFAKNVGASSAAALSSGTAALHLALRIVGVSAGDEVFVSTFTFVASANAICYLGAKPVFIDSETDTWNICPDLLESALEKAKKNQCLPKAIIVVDIYGQCANYQRISAIAKNYGVPIVEDAAEALGAFYKGKAAGTFGDIGCFSFNGNKIITTSGGGMLVSQDEEVCKRARYLASQAKEPVPHYEHSELGYNYRLSNILAALGIAQLQTLAERVRTKRQINLRYRNELKDVPGISFMPEPGDHESNAWLSCILVDPRSYGATCEDLRVALEAQNIESRRVWKPLHVQSLFKDAKREINGVSEALFGQGLAIPSGSSMTEADQSRVIEGVVTLHKVS